MNWVKNQEKMKNRLNETMFKNDPLHFNEDQYSTDDCFNSGCIVELKIEKNILHKHSMVLSLKNKI
jgi:hypothetical protein